MKYRTIIYYLIFGIILLSCKSNSQKNLIQCNNIANQNTIEEAFRSFEKDLFNYYNPLKDTTEIYKKFLSDVSYDSINFNSIPSNNSIKFAKNFKQNAKVDKSIWISYYDYNQNQTSEEEKTPITVKLNQVETKEEIDFRINQEKKMLLLNYRGDLIQCLKYNSDNPDLTEIIEKLELIGPLNPGMIASGFNRTDSKTSFNSIETKIFIAFEIYYYILIATL